MTTNYYDTFIHVAEDCPATEGQVPPERATGPTVASLQYGLLVDAPYSFTSDDLLFAVHVRRKDVTDDAPELERAKFFAREQACLRSSPLTKRYGWGIHHDGDGRIAIYAVGSDEYRRFAEDPALAHLWALRSRR